MIPFVAFAEFLEELANTWVKHFRRSPFTTLLATLMLTLCVSLGFVFLDSRQNSNRQAEQLENANFKEQIDQINELKGDVSKLLDFLEQQKTTLSDTEATISRLRSEKDKLEPLVETNRQVVEAIFRAQEERLSAGIWRERLIGFGLGIVASLVATFIWFVVTKLARPSENHEGEQAAP